MILRSIVTAAIRPAETWPPSEKWLWKWPTLG
jgi:hypothetical protein